MPTARQVVAVTDSHNAFLKAFESTTKKRPVTYKEFHAMLPVLRADVTNHYVGLHSDNRIDRVSYAAKLEHKHDTARRISTTLQRYLLRNFKDFDIDNVVLDQFVADFFSAAFPSDFEECEGQCLINAYRWGRGGSSCMTGDSSTYMQLLADNPDKVSLLLLKRGDQYLGRALLWTTDSGAKVLDRIYGHSQNRQRFIDKATKEGWLYRVASGLVDGACDVDLSDGSTQYVTLDFEGTCPYLDTFRHGYWSEDKTELYLSNDRRGWFLGRADSCSGEFYGYETMRVCCRACGSHQTATPGTDYECNSCGHDQFSY